MSEQVSTEKIERIIYRGMALLLMVIALSFLVGDYLLFVPLLERHDVINIAVAAASGLAMLSLRFHRLLHHALCMIALLGLVFSSYTLILRGEFVLHALEISENAPAIMEPHPRYGWWNGVNKKYNHKT